MRGGKRGDGHEVSILIRLGDGEREERAPLNVSTMIIRPPATRTWTQGRRSFGLAVRRVGRALGRGLGRGEQLSDALDVAGSNHSGEEAVVADAVEAVGQDVEEKAANELGGVERHGPEPVAAFDLVVLPFESHARLVEPDEPGIGDRDAVGVAREIGERGFRPGEGSFGVDDPLGAAQRRERGVESALVGELGVRSPKKTRRPASLKRGEAFEKEAAEQAREDAHRQEEAGHAGGPARPIRRHAATGNDDVDVRMMGERRAPGVEDGGQADARAQMLRVGGDREPACRQRILNRRS